MNRAIQGLRLTLVVLLGLFFIGMGISSSMAAGGNGSITIFFLSVVLTGLGVLIIYSQIRNVKTASRESSGMLSPTVEDTGGRILSAVGTTLTTFGHIVLGGSVLYVLYIIFGNYQSGDVSGIPFGVALFVVPVCYFLGSELKQSAPLKSGKAKPFFSKFALWSAAIGSFVGAGYCMLLILLALPALDAAPGYPGSSPVRNFGIAGFVILLFLFLGIRYAILLRAAYKSEK